MKYFLRNLILYLVCSRAVKIDERLVTNTNCSDSLEQSQDLKSALALDNRDFILFDQDGTIMWTYISDLKLLLVTNLDKHQWFLGRRILNNYN